MKSTIKLFLCLIFSLFLAFCSESETDENEEINITCVDTNCADYSSQAAAQAAFDADPECRNDLDRDNDGIACEELGNSVKICSSTSNCGCSNKRKDVCKRDPCCKWVVGTGCKCR